MRIRSIMVMLITTFMMTSMISCTKQVSLNNDTTEMEEVALKVWGAEEDDELLSKILDDFKSEYSEQANFDITLEHESEASCKSRLLSDVHEGADVFAFADDQLAVLVASGVLEPIKNNEDIINNNTKESSLAASINDKLYAYPMTADNGYFLYYNKQYFSEVDLKSLDKILEIADQNNKLFSMDWNSAWYLYSFFGNSGLNVGLNDDGVTNHCNWNSAGNNISGLDIARYMNSIAKRNSFMSLDDSGLVDGMKDGSIIAGVSGVWLATSVSDILGDNYGAIKLPSYNVNGKDIQMASFSGYKMVGVNSYSDNVEWAMKLADWITNEKNQVLRFEMRGQGPSNVNAASSESIEKSLAIKAILAQSEYSQLQRVGPNYWEPVTSFGKNLASKNVSDTDIQRLLDEMVNGITESIIKK